MASKQSEMFSEIPCELPVLRLPTRMDVIKAMIYEKNDKNCSFSESIPIVAEQIRKVWRQVEIPITSDAGLNAKIKDLQTEYRSQVKAKDPSNIFQVKFLQ